MQSIILPKCVILAGSEVVGQRIGLEESWAGGNALLGAGISRGQRCLISQSRVAERDVVSGIIEENQGPEAAADSLAYVGTRDEAHVLPDCWSRGCT
jgi:hypothetical protein